MGDDFMKQKVIKDREYWLKRIEEINVSSESYKKSQRLLEAEYELSKLGNNIYNPLKTIGYGKKATKVNIPFKKVRTNAND